MELTFDQRKSLFTTILLNSYRSMGCILSPYAVDMLPPKLDMFDKVDKLLIDKKKTVDERSGEKCGIFTFHGYLPLRQLICCSCYTSITQFDRFYRLYKL